MKYLRTSVILLVVLCTYEASAQSAAEKRAGIAIAAKLRSLASRSLDLMLVCDSSGSVGLSGFNDGKRGSKNTVSIIHQYRPISPFGSRVALIEFSEPDKTGVRFHFGTYNSHGSVQGAISRLRYDSGSSTATAKALNLALREFQNYSSGNKKLVWMFTDGRSNIGGSPNFPALQLKLTGVTVCVAAIGSSVNMMEINSIASPGCVHKFTSFPEYDRVMKFAVKQAKKKP